MRLFCVALCLIASLFGAPVAGQVTQPVPPDSTTKSLERGGDAPIIELPPGTKPLNPAASTPLFSDTLTPETVQDRLKALTENQTLEKAQKDSLVPLYQQAITDVKEAATASGQAADFAVKVDKLPGQVAAEKEHKEALLKKTEIKAPQGASLDELQAGLADREKDLSEARKRFDEAVNSLKNLTVNRIESSQPTKSLEEALAKTDQKLKEIVSIGQADPQTLAKRTQLRAEWQKLKANLDLIEKREAWQNAQKDLLPIKRDIAAIEVAQLEKEVAAWQDAVDKEKQAKLDRERAEDEAQARRAQTFKKYPSIAEHANENVQLSDRRQEMATRIPTAKEKRARAESELRTLKDNFQKSRERVAAAGSTMNVGTLLRLQQTKLPDTRELERNIYSRQAEIQKIQLASYEVNDRTKELANVSKATEDLLKTLQPAPSTAERDRLTAFVRELLETEKNHLDNLNKDYNQLLDELYELDEIENGLIKEAESYSQFISEHVLWIRSCEPIWKYPLADFREAFQSLLEPGAWGSVLVALGQDFWEHPGLWTFVVGVFGLLFIQQPKMRRRIHEIGKTAEKRGMTEFRPTLRVLVNTVMIAVLWPAALCWLGARLAQQLGAPTSVTAVGSALFAMGLIFFPVELLRQCCRTNGLVQSHFTWPAPVVTMIRRNLRWLKVFAPPFAFLAALFHAGASAAASAHESLGRMCFALALLMAAWFMHRVLRPSGYTFRALIADQKGGWIDRFKYVFYAAGVIVPFTLACLAVVGYFYTAEQLVTRFYATALLALGVILLDALIQRWLLMARRKLAIEQLRQRREAAQAKAQMQQADARQDGESPPAAQSPVVPNPIESDEGLDVSAMNDQTRQLVRNLLFVGIVVGLWGVWVDVLPALAVLKKVEIHALTIERVVEEPGPIVVESAQSQAEPSPTADQVAEAAPAAEAQESQPETTSKTIQVPITLADMLLSVLILIAAIAAAKNLPGMLEMMILQRLPIDNAARYAIATLSQYGLMIIGISAGCYVIGLRWQNVQWLAAALMVGLGFGLQEIFANFFSGLIVLLERPVRVGDIVTVGNTTGIVTKIRMRASTITNWERQEMIIPNKDLITGTVLNWTLSDTVQRVFIQVGVAYSSDTEKATETLYEVLKAHPQVMEEPPPLVTFAGFGDSTLNFEIRCFLPTAAVKLATTHELHLAIDKAFRKAGIEIAFPQLDLHLRSAEAGLTLQQSPQNADHGVQRAEDESYAKRA